MPFDAGKLRAPVECVLRVDGTEITQMYPFLREVRVEMSRKAATVCRLTLDSVRDKGGKWTVQDAGVFLPWKKILVEAMFGSHSEEVMRGYIKEVKVDYPNDMSAASVTVTAQDETLLLDREHKRVTWSTEQRPIADRSVVEQIAQPCGLAVQAAQGLSNKSLGQDSTAIKFLQDRAEANGFELFTRAGVLHFEPPELQAQPMDPILVYAGDATNCLNFSANFDGHKPDEVRVARAEEKGTAKDEVTVKSNLPSLGREGATSQGVGLSPFVWNMQQPSGATSTEVQSRAQAKANENAWKIVAEGELDGAVYGHVLLTFRTVTVDGVGETYGGVYYVDEVRHVFSADGYRQQFRLLRNAIGEQVAVRAADPLAAVRR